MASFLDISLIITSVGLILSVILQSKGAGLGGLTGADTGGVFTARRGLFRPCDHYYHPRTLILTSPCEGPPFHCPELGWRRLFFIYITYEKITLANSGCCCHDSDRSVAIA